MNFLSKTFWNPLALHDPLDTRPPAMVPLPGMYSRRDRMVQLFLAAVLGWLLGYRNGVYQVRNR